MAENIQLYEYIEDIPEYDGSFIAANAYDYTIWGIFGTSNYKLGIEKAFPAKFRNDGGIYVCTDYGTRVVYDGDGIYAFDNGHSSASIGKYSVVGQTAVTYDGVPYTFDILECNQTGNRYYAHLSDKTPKPYYDLVCTGTTYSYIYGMPEFHFITGKYVDLDFISDQVPCVAYAEEDDVVLFNPATFPKAYSAETTAGKEYTFEELGITQSLIDRYIYLIRQDALQTGEFNVTIQGLPLYYAEYDYTEGNNYTNNQIKLYTKSESGEYWYVLIDMNTNTVRVAYYKSDAK